MANFYIKKTVGSPVTIDDLGIEIQGGANAIYDLSSENASDIAISVDLVNAVTSGDLVVLDPRDSNVNVADRLGLSAAEGLIALDSANAPHYGIVGGRFASIDDPNAVINESTFLKYDQTSDVFESVPASDIINEGDSLEAIQSIIEDTLVEGDDIEFVVTPPSTPGAGDESISISVKDGSFLRGDGDDNVLSGNTITVDSGASIAVSAGGSLTVEDAPVNANDVANKAYVDSARAGLDSKESCLVATDSNLIGYNPTGGLSGTGEISGAPDTLDGISLSVGSRILVKSQTDPKQNGIYQVEQLGTGATGVWARAIDQNGDPLEDVSAGNFTLIEQGTFKNTGWVLQGEGILTLNTDDLTWVKINAANEYLAGSGLSLDTLTFSLDLNGLTSDTIQLDDELGFYDDIDGEHKKTTLQSLFDDRNIPYGLTGDGFAVKDSNGNWVSRTIESSLVDSELGLAVTDGVGASANPTIGLSIDGLDLGVTTIDATTDFIVVYDSDADKNVKYAVSDILAAADDTKSFSTWALSGNSSGDNIVADTSSDTATLTGGSGIELTGDNATKDLSIAFSKVGLADTAIDTADSIVFFDQTDSDAPKVITVENFLDDANVVVVDDSGNGIITKVSDNGDSGDFELRSIESATGDNLLGLNIVNGDLANGNAEIGLDINGLADSADNMAADDEFAVYDTSSTKNVSMSGQQIADGTAALLGLGSLELSTIDSQSFLTVVDDGRGGKKLSVDSTEFVFSENRLNPNNWINIGSSVNAFNGYVVPFDATVVYATSSCDAASGDFNLDIYVNGSPEGTAVSYANGDDNETQVNNTINIDVSKGDRLRVRAVSTSGSGRLEDTVISLFVKWRAA